MYDLKRNTSNSKMRIFCVENLDIIDKLERLTIADGKATGKPQLSPPRFSGFVKQILSDGTPLTPSSLAINGIDVQSFGYKNHEISLILKKLWHKCIITPSLNTKEWLTKMLDSKSLRNEISQKPQD
jgi:hypothetical protein